MDNTINIKGIDKARLLAELYNNSRPIGLGKLEYKPGNMSVTEAGVIIKNQLKKHTRWAKIMRFFGVKKYRLTYEEIRPYYFDYLHGRVMKVDIGEDEMSTYLYDRDNGKGAVARIVNKLKGELINNLKKIKDELEK